MIRVTKWMEEHLDELLVDRPAVFMTMAVIDRMEDLIAADGSWRMMLEDVYGLMLTERVSQIIFKPNTFLNFELFSRITIHC